MERIKRNEKKKIHEQNDLHDMKMRRICGARNNFENVVDCFFFIYKALFKIEIDRTQYN